MINIVIINGSGESGKDTFISYCENLLYFNGCSVRVVNYSSILTVKKACFHYFVNSSEKTDALRVFLSKIKDAWIEFNNGPFREFTMMMGDLLVSPRSTSWLVFCHIREPEEIEKIKDHYDVVPSVFVNTLLVKRPIHDIPECEKGQNCDKYRYDHVIENIDLLSLKEQAGYFLHKLYGMDF